MKFPKIKSFNIYFALLAGVFFVAAMNFTVLGPIVKNFVYTATQPAQKMTWGLGARISGGLRDLSSVQNALKENQDLRATIDRLRADSSRIGELEKENETLKEALNLGLDKEYDLRMAETFGMDMLSDSLIIDKGADDMIEVGFPVVTSDKVVVGRISKVYNNFSKVDLISSKNMAFDVNVSGSDANGLARGLGGLGLMLDLVPKEIEMKLGAPVTTSALGGIFPDGFLVGTIESVDKNDVETFQVAKIKPAFEIEKIKEVFIIIGYKFKEDQTKSVDKARKIN